MTRRAGFTLIELVVVIMILGILAGVAALKFFSTSGTATDNGIKQSLAIVRDAIELYAANNAGALPPCAAAPGDDFKTAIAQYIRGGATAFPKCPVGPAGCRDNEITPSAANPLVGATADGTGWKYNATTGSFILNNNTASSLGPTYDSF